MNQADNFLTEEPSSFKIDVEVEKTGPRHLTSSQAAALMHLCNLYALNGQPDRGGIKVKSRPLLVGPSGSGKTSIVRRLADTEGIKATLVVNCGAFVPNGAYSTPHTLDVIRQFVSRECTPENEQGIILLDELDKVCPHGGEAFSRSWTLGIMTEVISLLDADKKLQTNGWTESDIDRLSRHFIIGAGTWQSSLGAPQKGKKAIKQGDYAQKLEQGFGVPEEIIFRFGRLIEVHPPTAKDFVLAIRRIRSDLELSALDASSETCLANEYVASRQGMRIMEQYLAELLICHPESRRKPAFMTPAKQSDKIRMWKAEMNKRIMEAEQLTFAAQQPVMELQVHFQRLSQVAALSNDKRNHFDLDETRNFASLLKKFYSGLELTVAPSMSERREREVTLIVTGQELSDLMETWLAERAYGLKQTGVVNCMIRTLVLVRRILATWPYLAAVEVIDAPR